MGGQKPHRDFYKDMDIDLWRGKWLGEKGAGNVSQSLCQGRTKAGSPCGHGGIQGEMCSDLWSMSGERGNLTIRDMETCYSSYHFALFSHNLRGDWSSRKQKPEQQSHLRSSSCIQQVPPKLLLCAGPGAEGWGHRAISEMVPAIQELTDEWERKTQNKLWQSSVLVLEPQGGEWRMNLF